MEKELKAVLIGGDARMSYAARYLKGKGAKIEPWPCELEGREILLPTPAVRGGRVTGPCCISFDELLELLPAGKTVYGGAFDPASRGAAERRGIKLFDLLDRDELICRNARLTAEGAVFEVMARLDRSLSGARVLVIGYGRIGKSLCGMLRALGCEVTASCRKDSDRRHMLAAGIIPARTDALKGVLSGMDAVFNTVPSAVVGDELGELDPMTPVFELASAPGGFDREAAKKFGVHIIDLPGLPGKYAPKSAGEAIGAAFWDAVKGGRQ